MTRYAIYWAPEEKHTLWHAGCSWLGRDSRTAAATHATHEATEEPRRYGFHATLKAPITLRPERVPSDFIDAVQRVAHAHQPFRMPALRVDWLKDFLTLQAVEPIAADHALRRLADACVEELDLWRQPFDRPEFDRRSDGLDDEERANLIQWGYPYVQDRWRFHMTLTCSIPPSDGVRRASLQQAANVHFAAALGEPTDCKSICVFIEESAGQPFLLAHRFALG